MTDENETEAEAAEPGALADALEPAQADAEPETPKRTSGPGAVRSSRPTAARASAWGASRRPAAAPAGAPRAKAVVETPPMANERSGPGLGAVVGVSILTSALVSAGITFLIASGFNVVPDEEVPLLTGLTFEAAAGVADSNRLRIVNRGERPDTEIPAGEIVEQRPGAGSRVPRGSEVTVILSTGPELIVVPDVIGMTPSLARAALSTAGLTVSPAMDEGGTGDPGTISASDPAGGARVARESVVILTVVPVTAEPSGVTVGDYLGMSRTRAREAITALGLVAEPRSVSTTEYDPSRCDLCVLRQSPAAGTIVSPGSTVTLSINE